MKNLSLLIWLSQLGISVAVPLAGFVLLAVWLQNKFGLGMWILIVFGILGILVTISTVKANWKALQKAADEAAGRKDPPIAFNDHK